MTSTITTPSSSRGFVGALAFTFLYVLVDRPRYRDRCRLVFGLGGHAIVGFGVPLRSIFGPTIDDDGVDLAPDCVDRTPESYVRVCDWRLLWVS